MTDPRPCPACARVTGTRHRAQEQMLGLGDAFTILECDGCGSLRLLDPPSELERYYPPSYYAHGAAPELATRLPECLAGMDLSVTAPAWAAMGTAKTTDERAAIIRDCARRAVACYLGDELPASARILDVGSGTGAFVYWLRQLGYASALGLDPHVSTDVVTEDGVLVRRAELCDVEGEWDVIAFNHSLEHVPDPAPTLGLAARKLAEGGRCLVRIPVASSHAWEHYGVSWVQLDTPRHVFIPSEHGLRLMLDHAGLVLEHVRYDSGVFQFLGSEAYRRGEPLVSAQGELADWGSQVTLEELMALAQQAALLNLTGRGDQAAFVARRATSDDAGGRDA